MSELIEQVDVDEFNATIRRRPKNEAPLSDACCTPKWLADMLPHVDLDPASNLRSHINAGWSYALEKGLDGLRLPWRGSVFLNHPYSDPLPWMLKLNTELSLGRCTSAIVLAKLDSSPEWWKVVTAPIAVHNFTPKSIGGFTKFTQWYTPDLWLFNERIEFDVPEELIEQRRQKILALKAAGKKAPPEKTTNNFCSVIIHHRFEGQPLDLGTIAQLWRRPGSN